MTIKYEDAYSRDIGLFTQEEQGLLKKAKVFVAGTGGAGGIQAATLARFGIGEIVVMDPGIFDEPDMNRQYAAMESTIGQNKAEATAKLLRDINPFMKVTAIDYAPECKKALSDLIDDSTIVIDAIDYIGFDYKVMFAQVAREKNLYNLTAPVPDFATMLMIFDPAGMTFEEFFSSPESVEEQKKYQMPMLEISGDRSAKGLSDFLERKRPYLSTNSGAASLCGGVLAMEAVFIITGKREKEDIVCAPNVTYVDMFERKYEVYNPFE